MPENLNFSEVGGEKEESYGSRFAAGWILFILEGNSCCRNMPPICAEQEGRKGTEIVVDAHQLLRWMPVRMKSFGSGATLAKGSRVVCDVRGHGETNNIGDLETRYGSCRHQIRT